MKLLNINIQKYKSFTSDQIFNVEDDITILVGMNESGKTAALEAIAKTQYFQDDEDFLFNLTHDYPRKEKKKIDKAGTTPNAIICTYEIDEKLLKRIENELGGDVVKSNQLTITVDYQNKKNIKMPRINNSQFYSNKLRIEGIYSKTLIDKLEEIKSIADLNKVKEQYTEEKYIDGLSTLEPYLQNTNNWENPIHEFVYRSYLQPNLPKFLYYDEYFSLPSRISLEKLQQKKLNENQEKTAKALIELADIDIQELLKSNDFENFIAELEATEAIISEELFKYWKTNTNLNISFELDKIEGLDQNNHQKIIEHILDIRVKSKGVSLPLKNRSKGFNWFFSFLVWFNKIQEDKTNNYILLLDEPGLNLHASAQNDLLMFLEDLSDDYQIIYTTHSPFMIPSDKLNRVRTILETDSGSIISDSIQEKDPNTLFPLQAALGYDIAQNLFISKKNLLVEGVSDLIFLSTISGYLESIGRTSLRADVTIVPTGGLEKVATFISLLRGSQLEIVCLLDSYKNSTGKSKMENLIKEKIIQQNKILFFDQYLPSHNEADLEDLFDKPDYINLFNEAFDEYDNIEVTDLNSNISQIIIQINKHLGIERFNHYRPANQLAKFGIIETSLSPTSICNFENVFTSINCLFE